jgi:hypothetical protein
LEPPALVTVALFLGVAIPVLLLLLNGKEEGGSSVEAVPVLLVFLSKEGKRSAVKLFLVVSDWRDLLLPSLLLLLREIESAVSLDRLDFGIAADAIRAADLSFPLCSASLFWAILRSVFSRFVAPC